MKLRLLIVTALLALNPVAVQAEQELKPMQGTFASPEVAHVAVLGNDGLTTRRTVFSYTNGTNEVVGTTTSVYFVLDSPVKEVWPTFQNFNLWQRQKGVSFTGPFGDREGEIEYLMYQLDNRENVTIDKSMVFVVEQIVPEHLIVIHSPLWESLGADGKPSGRRHEGKNTFMLTEVDGKTVVTAVMEHAYHYYGEDSKSKSALFLKQKIKQNKARKRDIWEGFVPRLRAIVEDNK